MRAHGLAQDNSRRYAVMNGTIASAYLLIPKLDKKLMMRVEIKGDCEQRIYRSSVTSPKRAGIRKENSEVIFNYLFIRA